MTTIAPKTLFRRAAKFLLALPLLGLLAFGTPEARADDHHHRREHHRDNGDRNHGDRHRYEHQSRHNSGYSHNGRHYRHRGYHRVRHWRYANGRRTYYYVNEPYYYGLLPGGISVNIGL